MIILMCALSVCDLFGLVFALVASVFTTYWLSGLAKLRSTFFVSLRGVHSGAVLQWGVSVKAQCSPALSFPLS